MDRSSSRPAHQGSKAWWHPSYAIAIAIVFAAAVGAFWIGAEAGRFVTFLFVYLATVSTGIFTFVFLAKSAQASDRDAFLGGAALVVLLVTIGVAFFMPFSAIEYVATGVLR